MLAATVMAGPDSRSDTLATNPVTTTSNGRTTVLVPVEFGVWSAWGLHDVLNGLAGQRLVVSVQEHPVGTSRCIRSRNLLMSGMPAWMLHKWA